MLEDDKSSYIQAYLQFTSSSLAQQNFYLRDQETWLGSDPACQICLPDLAILPRHALFIWRRGSLSIQNYQQSLVLVNQQKVFDT